MYYFLFRKILYALLVLVGIGVVILVARSFFLPPGNRPDAEVAVQRPQVQENVPLPSAEVKSDLKAEAMPEPQSEPPLQERLADPQPPLLSKITPPPNRPAPIETKSPPRQVKAETKPAPPPTPKEAPKESKSETALKKPGSNNGLKKEFPAEDKSSFSAKNTIMVKAGDSIYAIAAKAYRVSNTSVVDRILEVNPGISDPDLLPAKQQIKLPLISEESLVLKSKDGSFRIRLGAFMKAEYADYLKKQVLLQDKEIEISSFKSPSGKSWYRVSAGKFESREEGLKVIRALKENGLSPYFEGFKKKN